MTREPQSERDRAYDAVRRLILTGQLQPNGELSQNVLAQSLGLGRTPIRDAISRLRNDGLVRYEPRSRRWLVRPVSPEELDDLYAMRILLEPFIARMAIEAVDEATTAQLRESLEASSQALRERDMNAFHHAHRAFHLGLSGGSGNWSQRTVVDLWDLAERYRRLMLTDLPSDERVATTIAQHEAIMDAVTARDPAAGSKALATHLATTAKELFAMFGPRFRPAAVETALTDVGLPLRNP